MVTWYWSADSLIWQVSIDYNMMSYIKKVHGKPGQHVSMNLLFGVCTPCCATRPSPSSSCVCATITWENQFMGFLYFPIWVWGSAWRPLELRYYRKDPFISRTLNIQAWFQKKKNSKKLSCKKSWSFVSRWLMLTINLVKSVYLQQH